MTVPPGRIKLFHRMIFSWWKSHRRSLPWRDTNDPYRILVSEVMLQQTQASRVIPKYIEFLNAFPTVKHLACASGAQVLRVWRGMGYNRRALYLKTAAEKVVQDYNGIFPDDEKLLSALPGLGPYTVRAVLIFAFRKQIYCIDTNIRKIFIFHFFNNKPQHESVIENVAQQLVPRGRSWEWHQALMDFGALEMPKLRKPRKIAEKGVPYRESDRYYRGRIIDRLREGPIGKSRIYTLFRQIYGKDREYTDNLLSRLAKEGLILRSANGIISLPE